MSVTEIIMGIMVFCGTFCITMVLLEKYLGGIRRYFPNARCPQRKK